MKQRMDMRSLYTLCPFLLGGKYDERQNKESNT